MVFNSVRFSHSVVSDSLWPHEPQHTRPPCPSPTPRVHPNSCPLSRWYHPTISSSVVPFSSCPQFFSSCPQSFTASVQHSCSIVSDSLWSHELQDARPPCPSPTPRVYSDSCPLSWWCHPTVSVSVIPFSHLQSFPASGSFQMSQFFASGGQIIGLSASASILPMNIQDWFPLGWTGGFLAVQGTLKSFLQYHSSSALSINSSALSFLYSPTLTSIHDYWKNHSVE